MKLIVKNRMSIYFYKFSKEYLSNHSKIFNSINQTRFESNEYYELTFKELIYLKIIEEFINEYNFKIYEDKLTCFYKNSSKIKSLLIEFIGISEELTLEEQLINFLSFFNINIINFDENYGSKFINSHKISIECNEQFSFYNLYNEYSFPLFNYLTSDNYNYNKDMKPLNYLNEELFYDFNIYEDILKKEYIYDFELYYIYFGSIIKNDKNKNKEIIDLFLKNKYFIYREIREEFNYLLAYNYKYLNNKMFFSLLFFKKIIF